MGEVFDAVPQDQEMPDRFDINIGELVEEVRNKVVHYCIETRSSKMWVRRIGLDNFAVAFGFHLNSEEWFVKQYLGEDMMQINSFIEGRGKPLSSDTEFYKASKNYSKYAATKDK